MVAVVFVLSAAKINEKYTNVPNRYQENSN
jgi:hypothetical protein